MNKQKLIIESDKEVSIERIDQWLTYRGLLEGMPTDRLNTMILNRTIEQAKELCGLDEVYLIEPTQVPFELDIEYALGKLMELPSVTCVIEVSSIDVFRDLDKDTSALGIVWLQNDYAFPIDEDILQKIKEIPFSKICGEFEL